MRWIYIVLLWGLAGPASGQQWVFRTAMERPRTGTASAVIEGKIYVLGGEDQFGNVLATAARYDPQTDQWEQLPPMGKARVFAAALALDGKLFVIGGRSDQGTVLDEVEYYDPVQNQWRAFPQLNVERQGLTAVVRNAQLFVAGGSDGQDELLETIEVYDGTSYDDPDGKWVSLEESEEDIELTGRIDALSASSITVSGLTFTVTDTTVIRDENDTPITLAALAVGMTVEVHGVRDAAETLFATRIEIEDRGEEEVEVTGLIEALGASSITVGGMTFAVTSETEIRDENDNPIPLAALAVGMTVEVHGVRDATGALFATRIQVEDEGGGGGQDEVEFCESTIDLNVGDTFNVRDYVQVKNDASIPVDWAQVFFTYTDAGANNPTVPADWNLAAFNAGQSVTIVAADTVAGTGNRGQGEYRLYLVRQGQAVFDDFTSFRIDDERESEVEDAKCANNRAASKNKDVGQLGTPRAAFAAASVENRVLFIGGFGQRGPLDLVQQLSPGGQVDELTPLPTARGNLAAAVIGDSVFVIGGHDGSDRILADILLRNPASGSWEPMPRLNTERESSTAAVVDGVIYVIGGKDAGGRVLSSVEAFGNVDMPTPASDEEPALIDFRLEQNYPNPFQTGTTITFVVSAAASDQSVRLTVYDLQGRRVATLVDGILAPGRHEVSWSGISRSGVPVGSGSYFYRLQQGDREAQKMMTLVH